MSCEVHVRFWERLGVRFPRATRHVFDRWMDRHCPDYPFARYADDGVVHCRSESQVRALKATLAQRFGACGLALHPEKTRIVCCNVNRARGSGVHKKFDFLGYCFRPRLVRSRQGALFVGFTPAISPAAAKRLRQRVRRWRLNVRTSLSVEELATSLNPIIRGWIQYYGAFQRSTLILVLRQIDRHLVKWVKRKYKKRGRYFERAKRWLGQVAHHQPGLFAHWRLARPFPAE